MFVYLGAIGLFMTEEQMKIYNSLKTLRCKKPQVTVPRPQVSPTPTRLQQTHCGSSFEWAAVFLPFCHCVRHQNKIRGLLFDLVTKDAFDIFFMVFACVQVVVMMVETRHQSFEKELILFWINFAIIVLFIAEFVLKVTALGRHYFAFGWNIFDFVLVILFILGESTDDVHCAAINIATSLKPLEPFIKSGQNEGGKQSMKGGRQSGLLSHEHF